MIENAASPDPLPRRVAVLGFERSGRALTDALLSRGVSVTVGDRRDASAFPGLAPFREKGAKFFLGGPPPSFLEGAEWLAISPGVPMSAPAVAAARSRGIPVLAELEIAWRIAEAEAPGRNRWIAVTGTNGKSTTTTWIADMLVRGGRRTALAGNIGAPLSGFLDEPRGRDYVCEVSSFQLEGVERFRADVAVLTNITPDHLDRYPSFAAYASAKARLFALQTVDGAAIVNADDPVSARMPVRARRLLFSRRGRPPAPGAWLESGAIWSDASGERRRVLETSRLSLPGAHNVENALAAVAAAESLGVPAAAIEAALTELRGLPHRTQLVAEAGGVRWVDDSKGTNVDATAKSLEAFAPSSVLLILGGRDKHGDFAALRPLVQRVARRVLTIGEAAGAIEKALSGATAIEPCDTMETAVARAAALARSGDTVLLSPACASFDQYRNYEARGDHFAALARAAADAMKVSSRG
ncbi:MAG TPA: UDP-N-acetylmuramoyl-L-alanine--D-glutamate ligase [Thermoanaerobaculia bacterium]|nr:UDP-N-acetylmuramoyl-L-alanine--D-glutamate ligase [Thermoanaerobaculia bacterium]